MKGRHLGKSALQDTSEWLKKAVHLHTTNVQDELNIHNMKRTGRSEDTETHLLHE
jgi:hypothetical protein